MNLSGVKLHFEVSGSGHVPVICIHGWACNGSQFAGLNPFLQKDFRIFCLDLPGHGQTPLDGFSPGFERYAGLLVDFALKHKLDRPVLLGHSMGGVLSLMAAASGRLQPRAVINLDGSLPPREETVAGQRLIRSWLDKPDFRERLRTMLRNAFFLPSERDARCETILQTMCSAPEAVLRAFPEQADALQPDRIGGAAPRYDVRKAANSIPQFHLEQIPDAGHFLHVYAANRVAAIVMSFLKPPLTA